MKITIVVEDADEAALLFVTANYNLQNPDAQVTAEEYLQARVTEVLGSYRSVVVAKKSEDRRDVIDKIAKLTDADFAEVESIVAGKPTDVVASVEAKQ